MKRKPQLVALGKLAPPRLARVVVRERLFERLDEFATRPIRVQTLGRFLIERDQQALPTTRKEQRKPLELLRLLIAQGGSGVNSQQLAHWLWPDAAGDPGGT